VDAGLDVRVPLESGIHAPVEAAELGRVLAEQMRSQLADAGAAARRVRGQVERPQRADLAVAGDARVRLEGDHGAVEHGYRFAAGPLVAALVQRQVHLVAADSRDLHAAPPGSEFASCYSTGSSVPWAAPTISLPYNHRKVRPSFPRFRIARRGVNDHAEK